jgi:hypothetical protein
VTGLIVLLVAVIVSLGAPGELALSPETAYEAGLLRSEPPPCRELTAGERRARGIDPKGKAATFSINGEWLCERTIFAYGERNSYADFVLEHAGERAAAVARGAAVLAAGDARLREKTWAVEAHAPSPELARRLARTFRHALAGTMGAGRVAAAATPAPDAATVIVDALAVQDPQLLFQVSVRVASDGKEALWRL